MAVLPGIGALAGPNAGPAAATLTVSGTPADADVGTAYTFTPTIGGGTSPFTCTISSGSLPGGLSIDASTGVVSGTPTTVENQTFTIHVADSGGQTVDLASVTIHVWGLLGQTTGTTSYNQSTSEIELIPITVGGAAIYVDKIVYGIASCATGTTQLRALIYTQTSSVPDALVASGTNTAVGATGNPLNKLLDLPFGSNISLSASTTYWIGAHNQDGTTEAMSAGSGPASRFKAASFASASPNPIGSTSTFGSYVRASIHYRLQ